MLTLKLCPLTNYLCDLEKSIYFHKHIATFNAIYEQIA